MEVATQESALSGKHEDLRSAFKTLVKSWAQPCTPIISELGREGPLDPGTYQLSVSSSVGNTVSKSTGLMEEDTQHYLLSHTNVHRHLHTQISTDTHKQNPCTRLHLHNFSSLLLSASPVALSMVRQGYW